ncbi:7c62aba9-4d2d-4a90-af68-c7364ed5a2c1 [Sclerotinia trifoliorum]|uniref:7c62aba9-4d2d-4a90-af68-c7364ed5a2c1 n=1 Tax=Sclerotinia trifoliorum TaxID=28548 RepID=A0A8H2W3Y1_9HELO|nr:7c62aba9-4d2d-4a90-af68-c7364ed5a2c1 [Sclerotinia trifoliorum]
MCHHMTRKSTDAHDWAWVKPYFENEPIPKLGFSATNQVFGGIAASVVTLDILGASSGGLIFYNWPTYKHEHYSQAPVLSPSKQKDWENIIYYPIHVSYFMSLQSREFWDVYVRKYGSKAAHAGPKIIGICQPKSNPDGPRTNIRLIHTIPASDRKNPGRFSRTKTKIAHSFDVEKRRMIAIISEAAKGVKPEVMEPVLASGEYGGQTFISPGTRADPVQMDCPRFDEIRWYLETNKFALAIHTMDFNMPAHLFKSYIDRHGGINLTNVK